MCIIVVCTRLCCGTEVSIVWEQPTETRGKGDRFLPFTASSANVCTQYIERCVEQSNMAI